MFEMDIKALMESLITANSKELDENSFRERKHRRMAINSVENTELILLRKKDWITLFTLKAQLVLLGDLEPSVKHRMKFE